MAKANYVYTAEYDYVSPSMYASARLANEMPPQEERRRADLKQVPKLNKKPEAKHAAQVHIAPGQAVKVILCLALLGVMLIGVVWTNARTSAINFNINQLKSANAALENEIAMLTINIESSNSIQSVDEYARKKLKMVYPSSGQCIYIDETSIGEGGLAEIIKAKAYGKTQTE